MRNRDSESGPEITETARSDSFSPIREDRNADERDVGSEPPKSNENSERVAETLTSRRFDRAIGYCVTEFNSADADLCAPAGGRRQTIDCHYAREPSCPMGCLVSPNHKIKEVGPADLTGNQITVNDLGGDYDDWNEGRCEEPTWDMIIQPTTCHFPRGGGTREQSGHEESG